MADKQVWNAGIGVFEAWKDNGDGTFSPTIRANVDYRILVEGELTIATAGLPVLLPSNTDAKAVQIFNNSGAIIVVGLAATVDAISDPKVGQLVMPMNCTDKIKVLSNSNEIAVDAETNATKVSYQILG